MRNFKLLMLLSVLCFHKGYAQNFKEQFKSLADKNDTIGESKLLKKWEAENAKDPDLIIACFNFYVSKSRHEYIALHLESKDENSTAITDSEGKEVSYIGPGKTFYDSSEIATGLAYADKGINLYPDRLDIRFGKIYILGEMGKYTDFTKEIVAATEYGARIKSKWKWADNKPLKDSLAFFLDGVQGYVETLYNADEGHFESIRTIAETVLKYYPDNVENLSNIAITYLVNKEYEKALVYLKKAETIAPKDAIVLNNIAEAFKRNNDKVNAAVYYNKVIKVGDEEQVADAKEKLEAMNKGGK